MKFTEIGVDEVGRGCIAGPVVACACFLGEGCEGYLHKIKDSKKLSETARQEVCSAISKDHTSLYGIASVSQEVIDEINILQASLLAMRCALFNLIEKLSQELRATITNVIFDGTFVPGRLEFLPNNIKSQAAIKADDRFKSVGAASILAKVERDKFMTQESKLYNEYGFDKNKGYLSKGHMQAIKAFGPCTLHRKTFEPIKSITQSSVERTLI